MLYLILNSDETFELRWVDYYSISGFDEIMSLEAGTFPPIPNNHSKDESGEANPTRQLSAQEQDQIVEDKIQEILEKKKKLERNVNVCMYGRHDLNGDKDLKFTVTHCYHNQNDDLFELEDLKKEFTGEVFENMKLNYMNLKNVKILKNEGKQNSPEYEQAFNQLQSNWDILKKLEEESRVNQAHDPYQNPRVHFGQQVTQYHNMLANKYDHVQINEGLQGLQPEQLAARRAMIHHQTQEIYRERFEENHQVNFSDLWDYINKKLQNEGENAFKMTSDNPQQSELLMQFLHHINENDELSQQIKELEEALEDPSIPNDERKKVEFQLKLLKLKPLQQKMREEVLSRYIHNKVALYNYKQQTQGDYLYERQLVDRDFYKRAKVYSSSKKEARTLDRFEQQMRSGQELRKKTRHKEFLNEILSHANKFTEFHKKRSNFIKKKAVIIKTSLDSKEKKEQMARDKEERDRIKLLKDNDFEGYINLINTQKNSRLLQILEQTHKYLEQLGAKVSIQKQENLLSKKKKLADKGSDDPNNDELKDKDDELNGKQVKLDQYGNEIENDDDQEMEDDDNEKIKSNLKNSSKIYYAITHTVQEEIKEQPKMIKGGTLKSYQMIGLNWLVSLYNNNLNGILADEMGLGKTIQTISLFSYLIEKKGNEGPFLVVVPLTTISNWSMEFDKWAPDIRKIIYKGKKHERPQLAQHLKNDKYHVVLTTYEYVLNDKSTLCKVPWQYIIVDEGHRMKNQKSKFALTLGQQYQSAHRVLLTGTPLQNNLSELWALLNFLLPKIFSSCEEFQKWFDKPLSKIHPLTSSKFNPNEKQAFELSEEEQLLIINRLHQVLRPFLLRRVKSEVEKELPNKIEMVIKVDLSAWQRIVYDGITDNGTLARDPSTGKLGNLALRNTVMQLRKICNHPYLFLDYYENEDLRENIFRSSGKFELLDRILPKMIRTGHKVLIFSQFTQLMDIMQHFFEFRGIKHLRLDGGTKHEDRSKNLAIFSSDQSDYQVFLLSTRAGGHGLNLQVADTVIIFDSDWNPQMDEQAKDRAHRIGQKREVRVYRLITTTKIEEGILSKATQKKDLDAKIIQAGMFNDKASDIDRQKKLEDLIRKDYEDDVDEGNQETEIPNDDQINDMIARDQSEYEIFSQMDQERYIEERKEERLAEIKRRFEQKHGHHHYMNFSNINYRLMQEWEVPEWIKIKPEDPNKLVEEFGMGKRQRKQVNYNDDISEGQWLKIIESGADLNQEVEKIKKKRMEGQTAIPTDNGVAPITKRRKLNNEQSLVSGVSNEDYGGEEGEYLSEDPLLAQENRVQIINGQSNGNKGGGSSGLKIQIMKSAAENGKDQDLESGEIEEDYEEEGLVMSDEEEGQIDINIEQQSHMNGGVNGYGGMNGRAKRKAAPNDLKEK